MEKYRQLLQLSILLTLSIFIKGGLIKPEDSTILCPKMCTCNLWHDKINCRGKNVSNEIDFRELYYLAIDLDLSNNFYHYFPKSLSTFSVLKRLNISRNLLSSIDTNLHLNVRLKVLDLSENNFSKIKEIEAVSQLKALEILYLSKNKFQFLDGLKINTLRELYADDCGIQFFDSNTLDGLPKLAVLTLSGNHVKSIYYPQYSSLGFLDLSRTGLTSIGTIDLMGLKNLLYLRLTENPDMKYDLRTLKHPILQILILDGSTYVSSSGLPNLRNWTRDEVKDIEKIIFSKSRNDKYNFQKWVHSLVKRDIEAKRLLDIWEDSPLLDLTDEFVSELVIEKNEEEDQRSYDWKILGQTICYVITGILVVVVSAWSIYQAWRLEVTPTNT